MPNESKHSPLPKLELIPIYWARNSEKEARTVAHYIIKGDGLYLEKIQDEATGKSIVRAVNTHADLLVMMERALTDELGDNWRDEVRTMLNSSKAKEQP